MPIRKFTETFDIDLSDVISDEADAADAEAIEKQFYDAVARMVQKGVSEGVSPVGKMRVTLEQGVS